MARKDKEADRAYKREWGKKKYHKRMAEIRNSLGGKCEHCGSTDNLEIDHIDSTNKALEISMLWSNRKDKITEELTKCRLLCESCHILKTIKERGKTPTKGCNVHGTVTSYKYCRCDLCYKARSDYSKEYYRRKRL